MVKDAEANKEADKKKRETVDARNQADTIVHSTEKNLKEHGSKIAETDKKAIETGISDLKNALKGTDTEEVKKKTQQYLLRKARSFQPPKITTPQFLSEFYKVKERWLVITNY